MAATPGRPGREGNLSLEVRWIVPGRLDTAVAEWFGSGAELEDREDAYLLDPHVDGLSMKVRAGQALEVKVFRGSPGFIHVPGRVAGRLQYWQKWSFPFRSHRPDSTGPGTWQRVRKRRRTSRFTLAGSRSEVHGRVLASDASCAVELTEIRMGSRDWWSLGLEATGPGWSLRPAVETAAALMFARALPDGLELGTDNSVSYMEWLASQPDRAGPAGPRASPVIHGG